MTDNPYLTHYVHGCRRFRKDGDYWLSQYKVHPSKEKMEMVREHMVKRYPDAIIKVFKVRCHGRSWLYGVYWIRPEQMKQQDKERKDAESPLDVGYRCGGCGGGSWDMRKVLNYGFGDDGKLIMGEDGQPQDFEYYECFNCYHTTKRQPVKKEMGDCYMCDKPAVFIAHDLPTGKKPFCSELHFCQYARLTYHGEGYYGFTDPAKVKEPARLARARKRLKYAETENKWKVGDKVKILNNELGNEFDIGEIVTLVENEAANSWRAKNDEGEEWHIEENGCGILVKDKYTPKYKVGDILNLKTNKQGLDRIEIIELQHHGKYKDFYHCKYLDGVAKNIFVDIHFEELDSNKNYELYVPPNTNPRKARLKKRFGLGSETFESKGYAPDKPYYATHHEEVPTTIMHPVHCGHYKMVMDGRGKWYLAGFYDTIEEMFTDIFNYHMDSQIDGMLEDLNSEQGQERKRQYQAIRTIGDARKFAKKQFDFKLDFAPCFRKQADYDAKALNALPITVFPIYEEYEAESNGDKQLELAVKRTKMSMIRTGLAITTFGIVIWNLWTNKKQEKQIADIMGLV